MRYNIVFSEEFPLELIKVPKKVHNAYQRILDILRSAPDTADPPRIKRLDKGNGLWRMQVGGEYRLVYKVSKREVTLLMIGHRSEIYDRLETVKLSESGVVVGPSRGEILNSKQASEDYDFAPTTSPAPDNPLPYPLTRDILDSWGVPREYHNKFYGIKTEGELIELEDVPQEVMLRVMNGLWPKSLAEIEQKPVRVANSPAEIDDAAQGKRSLASFLLRLDEEQEEFVSRFKGTAKPKGPWLLKGGPGSGKSTIALYLFEGASP